MIKNEIKRGQGWKGFYGSSHPKSKQIVQKDPKTGDIINVWDTIEQAATHLNINKGNITRCCQNRRKTAGKYNFDYKYAELQKVFKYDKDFNFIKSYDTVTQAAKKNHINTLQILNSCLGNISYLGRDKNASNSDENIHLWRFYRLI